MLASGAHVDIGGYEFKIDKSVPDHYQHRYYDVMPEKLLIEGTLDKNSLLPDNLNWTMDDWAGGEGNVMFAREQYDRYFISGSLNPRIRGQLTGPPAVTEYEDSSLLLTQAKLSVALNNLYAERSNYLGYRYSGSGVWAQLAEDTTCDSTLAAVHWSHVTSAAGIRYMASDTGRLVAGDTIVATASSDEWTGPAKGIAVLDGAAFIWDGNVLVQYTPDPDACPYTVATVYVAQATFDADSTTGGAFATENSVVMWVNYDGDKGVMYEYRNGAGRPIWRTPLGFTLTDACYNNGIVYLVGHWGSAGEGWGELYGIALDSYASTSLAQIRPMDGDYVLSGVTPTQVSASYGNSVLIAGGDYPVVWVYNAEIDALSVLMDIRDVFNGSSTIDQVQGVATLNGIRYALVREDSGDYCVYEIEDDYPGEREPYLDPAKNVTNDSDFSLTSSTWDLGYPAEVKALMGFTVVFRAPLIAGQEFNVYYKVKADQVTGWVPAGTVTPSSEGADIGRVYLQVSTPDTPITFASLQFKVEFVSDVAQQPPILYAITANSKLTKKREEWELLVRLKDEQSRERPSDRQVLGSTLRDWLLGVLPTGTVTTLLDGYRYHQPDTYTTHLVTVKEINDNIFEPGEGVARVLLVANEGTP